MAAIAPGLAPPVSDGALVNGVAHFVRTTKPTTRIDGSALVVGDRWYKADDGTEWFWNGTYWLSTQIFYGGGQANSTSSASASFPSNNLTFAQVPFNYSLFVQDLHIKYSVLTADTSNFWVAGVTVWICTSTMSGASSYFKTINTSTGGASTYVTETIPQNVVLTSNDTTAAYTITGRTGKAGTPSDLSFVARISYRLIAP